MPVNTPTDPEPTTTSTRRGSTATRRPGGLNRRSLLGGAAAALGLAATGAGAWALDRFVIDHVQIADVDSYEAAHSTGESAAGSSAAGTVTGDGYSSDQVQLSIDTVDTGTVTYFVADLVLSDATAFRSAFAKNSFGTNIVEYTSDIAVDNGAVFAVNGDYYGFRETGIVIRNGIAYRDAGAREGMALYRDGRVEIYDETTTSAAALVADGAWTTLSFGPAIVRDGSVVSGIDTVEIDTNVGNHSIQGDQPRTAIGVVADNHVLLVVVDGRSEGYSAGLTLPGLADVFVGLGARTAYNLDGGGSSTMWFDGALVNNPLGKGQERGTSDILYIAA